MPSKKQKEVRTVTSVIIPYNQSEGDIRKFVYVKDDGKWAPPGGKLEGTDYDIKIAATREVQEETGLCVILKNFIGVYTFESSNKNLVYNTAFLAEVESGNFRDRNTKEIEEVDYFSLAEIRKMAQNDELRSGQASVQPVEDYLNGQLLPLSTFKRIRT